MSWNYQGKIINEISDFPKDTFGFVYKIYHIPSSRIYIGKKFLELNRKKKLTKKELLEYKGKPGRTPTHRRIQVESDWKTYYGSNVELKKLVKEEPPENFIREIIRICYNKKTLTYYETKYLFNEEAIENPEKYFNQDILGKFHTSDLEL
jgi:hypothetical protein